MPFKYLLTHQSFVSVAEMDCAVAAQLTRHTLSKSERTILLRIAQSALNYPGAAHLKAATIAKAVHVSTKTVYRAVKRMQALNIIRVIPATKLNGIKGANIYQIVPSEMSERALCDAPYEDLYEQPLSEKQTISFHLLQTSKLNKIYKDIQYMNDYQQQLYALLMSLPMKEELKDALYATILSTPITNHREFTIARDTLMRILLDIDSGKLTVRTTIRAVFRGAYNIAIVRPAIKNHPKPLCKRPVPFYDWLTIRA